MLQVNLFAERTMNRFLAKTVIAGLLASGSMALGSLPATAASAFPLPQLAAQLDAGALSTSYAQFRHHGFRGRGYGRRGFYGRRHYLGYDGLRHPCP
jgi:hypothetical protein